ncbi:hypothetical protein BDD12DRAFT_832385 [Trichophaea hybrida]|nr:hypothetical protein BDD12DRAFT_832385 [Trichophaea hybrida]
MQDIEQQPRPYTLTQRTSFLVVIRRNDGYTGIVTDQVQVQTAVVTMSSTTSRFEYEQYFGTNVPTPTPTPTSSAKNGNHSTGFIMALSIGIPILLIFGALFFYLYRRRQQGLIAGANTNALTHSSKSHSNSNKRSQSTTSLHSTSGSPNAPPIRQSPVEEIRRTRVTERTSSPQQLPQRSDTGTPIAELQSPDHNHHPTHFQKRRSTLPPLPRLKIERINTRRTSRQSNQIPPTTPDALVSCLTLVAPQNQLSRHRTSDLSFLRSPTAAAAGPLSPLSPIGPSSFPVVASASSHPQVKQIFPYGYQSEYPEVFESGPSKPAAAVLSPAERQREMQFLAEEERLIRQRVWATEELIRLKNEEARILDRKKRLVIGQ